MENKSNITIFWKWLISLFITVILINIVFHKYISIVSFTNLFMIIIPNWLFTFYLNRIEIKRIKHEFSKYMQEKYPQRLQDFYDNYHSDTNPGTKPIFALFMDKELLKDEHISRFRIDSNKVIMLFVSVSAITIMTFLISTVFIMKVQYFS